MKAHLRYLRYVVFHKLYVLRAGLAIRRVMGDAGGASYLGWLWRLLVHDRSKFSRAEWTPYVASFYGLPPDEVARRTTRDLQWVGGTPEPENSIALRAAQIKRDRQAAFNAAWLHHIHHNPHHWQHHVLLEDSGKTIVLIPPAWLVFEMVADWMGAGPKVHKHHSVAEAVRDTIVWYAANHRRMQMRDIVRSTVESILMAMSNAYGITDLAAEVMSAHEARVSITIPGR